MTTHEDGDDIDDDGSAADDEAVLCFTTHGTSAGNGNAAAAKNV